jgi:V8-like Glu-specific endopeptidase
MSASHKISSHKIKAANEDGAPVPSAGPHAPVSNLDLEHAGKPVRQAKSQAPSAGRDPRGVVPAAGDTERVGAGRLRVATAESARTLSVPDTAGLRDIGEASFGAPPPRAETVHGPDDRVRITDTAQYPWRAHASLLVVARDNSQWIGTGWFIGPRTLITAGHVMHIKNSGVPGRDGWVKSVQVMPGRDGSTLPYGSVTSTSFRAVRGWTDSGDQNFDYGAIILPTDLGNTTGWFGFGAYPDADLLSSTGNISGYPGDQPAGTQWYDSRKIASVDARKVYYDIDTAGGQSGSAVYRTVDGNRMAFAIHAYGGAVTNSGTRINAEVYNNMVAWKAGT